MKIIMILRLIGIAEIFIGGINFITYGNVFLSLFIMLMGISCVICADIIERKYNG